MAVTTRGPILIVATHMPAPTRVMAPLTLARILARAARTLVPTLVAAAPTLVPMLERAARMVCAHSTFVIRARTSHMDTSDNFRSMSHRVSF